ncbi:glycine betaine ABC transporter substrate-binding protein [Paenibacillus sp. J2TS4]|uniref:glycine betaine ABC transporter substrate-binding protein n=1 Tax=Paenibacillus sp. J2TS4 TaxID=2807194 RepID=UPI001B145A61|nr:glycine betaine ABC transporter substrate-binding protein [Paenibacillus sp. J2TS4]GIP33214.1 glycine/betaine ABC transporter substrate-binding protein [Paenibacillus sp. J2TS4]
MLKKGLTFVLTASLGLSLLAGCSSGDKAQSDFIGDQVNYEIIGIDPGAGLMEATEKVLEEYELTEWKLIEGSDTAMTASLEKAYKDKKPIIITGWTPHWKFAKYDLKYLEDPKGIYGPDEKIHTIVRNGLKEDDPGAYQLLDNFEWTPADMEKVMVDVYEGKKPEEAAEKWVNDNADKVDGWIKDIPQGEGKKLKLAYVAWDSEIASTHVVKYVLEEKLGYKVEALQVEVAPMWVGVAKGDVDGMVAAWLPTTHQRHYETHEGNFEDLGPNLVGTKLGLVVPSYVDINSIEDLKKKE